MEALPEVPDLGRRHIPTRRHSVISGASCCPVIVALLFTEGSSTRPSFPGTRPSYVHLLWGTDNPIGRFAETIAIRNHKPSTLDPKVPGGAPGGLRRRGRNFPFPTPDIPSVSLSQTAAARSSEPKTWRPPPTFAPIPRLHPQRSSSIGTSSLSPISACAFLPHRMTAPGRRTQILRPQATK